MPFPKLGILLCCLCGNIIFASSVSASLNVVTTIKPLHSIVANIMRGVGEPHLLIDSTISPHDYKLKPSNARALGKADVIFWVGPALENRLSKAIQAKSKSSKIIQLMKSKKLDILEMRGGDNHHHGHAGDPHVWLSIKNAKSIATLITDTLSRSDMENRVIYVENLEDYLKVLTKLHSDISKNLESYSKSAILMHHDAFQYFEKEFQLLSFGAVTPTSEFRPGAKRVIQLRKLVKEKNIACVFSEPQFNKKILISVTSHSKAKIGTIDPIGVNLSAGPNLYLELMTQISESMVDCLSKP